MRKPRPLNTLIVDARINKSERGHYIEINAGGCPTPKAIARLIEWLADAQVWIALQGKNK